MTATINGNNQVEEQPATYNRNFQVMLIAGLVFVVIVMVYASLFRARPGDRQIEEQVQREISRQTPLDPEQEFREQIKNQEQRLQKQRSHDISEQGEYIDEKTDELSQNNEQVLQELLSGAKSPVEAWKESESVRVRQSRQSEFNFELFSGMTDTLKQPTDTRDDGFLQQEQAILAELQQRVKRYPQQPITSTNYSHRDRAVSRFAGAGATAS